MSKWIYSVVVEESAPDGYDRLDVRESYGTKKKALHAIEKLVDFMCKNGYEVVDDSNLAYFTSSGKIWAEIMLPATGLHIRYTIMDNQLY